MASIRIASSDPLSTFFSQAESLGKRLVQDGIASDLEVLPTTGSVANALMVASGEADLGFMASNWVPRALAGKPPFKASVPVSVIAPLNAGPLFFVVREESPISTVADLRGRRVAVGHRDSGMAQHVLNFLRCWEWGETGMELVYVSTFDGGEALRRGDVDAQFQAPVPNVHFSALCESLPIRVLDCPKPLIDKACRVFPFYFPTLVPAEHVIGMDQDSPTIGVLNVMVASQTAPEDQVEAIVTSFIAGAGDLGDDNALFRGLEGLLRLSGARGARAMIPGGLRLHPGAERAFRKAGLFG